MKRIGQMLLEEEGATMVEYALMLGLIAMVVFLAVAAVGNRTNAKFDQMAENMK